MRTIAAMIALALSAGAFGHEIESICRGAVGTEVPTRAEYEADRNAHADNFCAALLYNPAVVIGQLGKVLKTNRAWANPNRHYFNPKLNPNTDYIQILRPWMAGAGWAVYRNEDTEYGTPGYFRVHRHNYAGTVAVAVICPPHDAKCFRLLVRRARVLWGYEDRNAPMGAWHVRITETWVSPSVNDSAERRYIPAASQVRCFVEGVLDDLETATGRDDLDALGDTVATDCNVPDDVP